MATVLLCDAILSTYPLVAST